MEHNPKSVRLNKFWLSEPSQGHFRKTLNIWSLRKNCPAGSRLLPLHPFLGPDGFLQVGGRLRKSPLLETGRNPIILDPSHTVTSLIIAHYHQRLYCSGVEHIVNELWQQYWILRGLCAVMKASSSCVLCRLSRSRPCPPVMADLPEAHLGYEAPPFTHSGVDYFGLIQVRHSRKTEKRYGVLFTCIATRAVHSEVAHSLDADSHIMAIRRMIARYGKNAHLWSDCGTNFVSANKEICQAIRRWNQLQIEDQLCQEGIQWHFNPPASLHFGGAWERLVKSAKKSLNTIAARQCVTDKTLLTFLTEVESLLTRLARLRSTDTVSFLNWPRKQHSPNGCCHRPWHEQQEEMEAHPSNDKPLLETLAPWVCPIPHRTA